MPTMTAFFTRCCKKTDPACQCGQRGRRVINLARLRAVLLPVAVWLLSLGLGSLAATAHADGIEAKQASVIATDEGYALSAEFNIEFSRRLEDVITRGIPLYFDFEVIVERPRKYWVNEHIVTRSFMYRLSYHGLTKQYRLARVTQATPDGSSLYQSFEKLSDALRVMSRIHALPLVDRQRLTPGESYLARLRLALNQSQLPKPFQIDAITDSGWRIAAKTMEWSFIAPSPLPTGTP